MAKGNFEVKAEAMRLKDSVVAEDREKFAQLVSAVGQLEADSNALDELVTALAPRVPDADVRGLNNRDAARALIAGLVADQAKQEAARGNKTSKTKREGE